jgi:hypothetical protein
MYRIRNKGLYSMCVADLCELSGYEEVRRSSAHEASLQDATHVSTVHVIYTVVPKLQDEINILVSVVDP